MKAAQEAAEALARQAERKAKGTDGRVRYAEVLSVEPVSARVLDARFRLHEDELAIPNHVKARLEKGDTLIVSKMHDGDWTLINWINADGAQGGGDQNHEERIQAIEDWIDSGVWEG